MAKTILKRAAIALASVPLACFVQQAQADSTTLMNEVRGGLAVHDINGDETGADLNAEFLGGFAGAQFDVPLLEMPATLRPHVGANVNLNGDTSSAYAGYTMTMDVSDKLFVEGGLGGMIHNGKTDSDYSDRANLGCRVLLRKSIGVGLRLTENVNVSSTLSHASNLGACSPNDGMANLDVRVGYSF